MLLAIQLTGCGSSLASGEVALPTFQTEVHGAPVACAGVAYAVPVIIHGSPNDPAVAWIVFGTDGHRQNLLWPPGYRARFTPTLVVVDPRGHVVAREGEYATGGCPMPPDGTWISLPTRTTPPQYSPPP